MRILIDCRCLQERTPRGGVGVYTEGIVHALIAGHRDIEWLLYANGFVDPRRRLPQYHAPDVRWVIRRWPNRITNLASTFRISVPELPAVDVIFLPNLNFLPSLPARTRLVVTVHDLSFEHFPDCSTWQQRLWHRMVRPRQLLARADAIIAVSETTKRDVEEMYGIPTSKVHVVYPGISSSLPTPHSAPVGYVPAHHRLPARFILSLSAMEPRKNIDGLIAAYELLRRDARREIPALVLAGLPGCASRAIHAQIVRSPARDRIHLIGPVTENEKHALLARASCFVYPSLWEGFGFPPLEAMAAGVPVVASTGGALPEVLGDAALLVDPLDPAAIADAIERALTDEVLRQDLIARGRARAARYRWEDAAMQCRRILTDR